MSEVISENGQTRFKNSYASSSEAKLTLRVNGEELGVVITPDGSVVRAGIPAPDIAPTASDGGAGSVPEGYYVYRYAYASSRYPFVANDTTADGEEWPRSSPSDPSNTFQVTGGTRQVSLLVTYSTRSDIDYILVYRTIAQTSAADAEAQDAAGQLFFVGRLTNNTAGGSTTYTDNAESDTGEQMDLDNYECPLFRYTVFDGFYWWGFGNTTLTVVVTLDGTSTFSINTGESDIDSWFSGRDGYTINFVGITTGGYDGRGNYYFKASTSTTGQAFVGSDLVTPSVIPATGTTTAYLTAPSTTLYRSKRLNPFSWGNTTTLNNNVPVPQLWAERIGGGTGTGLSLIPNERILKLDTEGPQKSFALDLNAADSDAFLSTLRTLDEAQSTSSQFSQFPMRNGNGQSTLSSINAKAFQILSADGQSQVPIGENVKRLLDRMVNDGTNPDFYHGVFDYRTRLNCWFLKTTDSPFKCDTLIFQHYPTGKWGMRYVPISASCMVYDDYSRDHYTFVGDEYGRIGILFSEGVYYDWLTTQDRLGTWFLTPGEPGYMTIEPIASGLTVTINGDGSGSGISGAGLVTGRVYRLGTSGGTARFVVLDATAGTFFIPDNLMAASTYPDSVVVEDFTAILISAVSTDLSQRYVVTTWNDLNFQQLDESGNAQFSVADTNNFGINLDTGNLEQITATLESGAINWTLYAGCTLTSAYRVFSANNPQQSKQIVESYATLENTTDQAIRYLFEQSQTNMLAGVPMSQDVTNGTDSLRYFYKTPTSTLMPTFGIDLQDAGYEQYRLRDFTHNISNA